MYINKLSNTNIKINKIIILLILLIICIFLVIIFHLVLDIHVVYTHFFYISIIFSCIYWKKKGLIVTIILSGVILIPHFVFPHHENNIIPFYEDISRILMFFLVSVITICISEKISKKNLYIKQLLNYNRILIESSPDVQVTIDKDYSITDVNKAFENLFCKSREKTINSSIFNYFSKESLIKSLSTIYDKKQIKNIEVKIEQPDEKKIILNLFMTVFQKQDEENFIYITGRDITDYKLREENIRKFNKHLNIQNQKLLHISRFKTKFLNNISHEFKTPLNSILGFTGIILKGITGSINDEQRKQLNIVYRNSKHLLFLINNLLDVSSIETGKIKLNMKYFLLADVINSSLDIIKPLAEEKELKIVLNSLLPEDTEIYSDEIRLKQIILNLLDNAVKYTENGYIEINTLFFDDMRNIGIVISDTGIGIKKENIEFIFDEFYKIDDKSLTIRTGLGLYICKKLANFLNCKIFAESEYHRGSKFTLIIPVK